MFRVRFAPRVGPFVLTHTRRTRRRTGIGPLIALAVFAVGAGVAYPWFGLAEIAVVIGLVVLAVRRL